MNAALITGSVYQINITVAYRPSFYVSCYTVCNTPYSNRFEMVLQIPFAPGWFSALSALFTGHSGCGTFLDNAIGIPSMFEILDCCIAGFIQSMKCEQ